MKDTHVGILQNTIVKRTTYFFNAIMAPKPLSFDIIREKTRTGSFTRYEEEAIASSLNETFLPLFRWSVTGFLLLLLLARWCRDYTGPVIILLSIYLVGGLLVFWRDRDMKAGELKRQLQDDTIIISTRSEKGWGILIVYLAVIVAIFCYMVSTGILESSARLWHKGDLQFKTDLVAFHLSLFMSISAIFLSVFQYVRTNRIVITTKGIYTDSLFLAWADLATAKIEMPRFKKPFLVVETKEGDSITINITRLRLDRNKVIELDARFAALVEKQGGPV